MNARIGCALVLGGIIIISIGLVNSLFDANEQATQMKEQARKTRIDQGNRERGAKIPKGLREDLFNALKEGVPDKYKKMSGEYFKAIAGGEKKK